MSKLKWTSVNPNIMGQPTSSNLNPKYRVVAYRPDVAGGNSGARINMLIW